MKDPFRELPADVAAARILLRQKVWSGEARKSVWAHKPVSSGI
jgi:hypothetical protein